MLFVTIRASTAWPGTFLAGSKAITSTSNVTETFVFTATTTGTVYFWFVADGAGTTNFAADNASVKELPGNHLTAINDAARGTYNTDGTLHWIAYDGVDDGYVSPTITPGIDKAQVFAGVRKLSDAAEGVLIELSSGFANFGSLTLSAPRSSASREYGAFFRDVNSTITTVGANAAPSTDLLTWTFDKSVAPSISGRLNGEQNTSGGTAHTGSFGTYPLYVGRRGGTTLPFNGRDYGLIVRFGPNLDLAAIQQVEAYLAARTGVTL
jgi:hypothetical protein